MKKSGIYRIINTENKRFYIGSSNNIDRRIKTHFQELKAGKHINKQMQADYTKGDHFIYEIVAELPGVHEELLREERRQIEKAEKAGASLYNEGDLCGLYYSSRQEIIEYMADQYCQEHLKIKLCHLFAKSEAEYNMHYHILKEPEREEEIKAYYKPAIEYQKKDKFYRYHYKIPYYEVLKMSDAERKELIKSGKKEKVNAGTVASDQKT